MSDLEGCELACSLGRKFREKRRRRQQREARGKRDSGEKKTQLWYKLNDLLLSEYRYLDNLHIGISKYLQPLLVANENLISPILPVSDIAGIFGNMTQIFQVNMLLLKIIEGNLYPEKVDDEVNSSDGSERLSFSSSTTSTTANSQAGDGPSQLDNLSVFVEAFTGELIPTLSAFYKIYALEYNNARELLAKCLDENQGFERFHEIVATESKKKLLDILITPIQRLCQYPLFFKDLLKLTGPEHQSYAKVNEALTKVNLLAEKVNSSMHAAQEKVRAFQISETLYDVPKDKEMEVQVVAPGRTYIKEWTCKLNYTSQTTGVQLKKDVFSDTHRKKVRELFLFSDVLLIAKQVGDRYEFRRWLPLNEIFVNLPPIKMASNANDKLKHYQLNIIHYLTTKQDCSEQATITPKQTKAGQPPVPPPIASGSERCLFVYTIWFKTERERTDMLTRINELKTEAEENREQRLRHINTVDSTEKALTADRQQNHDPVATA